MRGRRAAWGPNWGWFLGFHEIYKTAFFIHSSSKNIVFVGCMWRRSFWLVKHRSNVKKLIRRKQVFSDFVVINMCIPTYILRCKTNIYGFCWRGRPRYMFALLYRKAQVKCFKTESGYACFRTCCSCTDVHLDLCFAMQNACPRFHVKSVCFFCIWAFRL